MKHIIILVLYIALALGCGAPPEELELEQLDEGITAQLNGQGWRLDGGQLGNAQKTCVSAGGTGQKCMLPGDKSITIRLDTAGMASSDVTAATASVNSVISSFNAQFSSGGWSFATGNISPDLRIVKGTTDNVAGATDIRRYVTLSCALEGSVLTEPPPGYDGTYRRCANVVATVDYPKITASFGGGSPGAVPNVITHAVGSAIAASASAGLIGGNAGRITSQTTSSSAKNITLSSIEQCRVNSYVATSTSSITLQNTCF
jgi:hypothetical protein